MKALVLACDVGGREDYAALAGVLIQKGELGTLGSSGPRRLFTTYLDQMKGVGYLELARGMLDLIAYYVQEERATVFPVVDARGVGAGVMEILAESNVRPLALIATTGFHEHQPKPILSNTALQLSVSNSALLTTIRTVRADNELKVDATLDHAEELGRQMMNVEPQLTAKKKSERFDAPTGQHDDLLAATMMAVYVAVRLDSPDRAVSLAPWVRYLGVGKHRARENESTSRMSVGAWT